MSPRFVNTYRPSRCSPVCSIIAMLLLLAAGLGLPAMPMYGKPCVLTSVQPSSVRLSNLAMTVLQDGLPGSEPAAGTGAGLGSSDGRATVDVRSPSSLHQPAGGPSLSQQAPGKALKGSVGSLCQ